MGIDAVILGLSPVDGFHVQCMSKNEGDILAVAEVGKPVPGEDALDADHDIFAIRLDGLQEWLRLGLQVPVKNNCALIV